jgi:hypothetical protein
VSPPCVSCQWDRGRAATAAGTGAATAAGTGAAAAAAAIAVVGATVALVLFR